MPDLMKNLAGIAKKIAGGVTPEKVTVRELLKWNDCYRRGSNVNWEIRKALEKTGLETQPDFEWAYIDGEISFVSIGSDEDKAEPIMSYRVDGLESANRKPLSISPDSDLSQAITMMLQNDYLQLPVMTTDREVKGIIRAS